MSLPTFELGVAFNSTPMGDWGDENLLLNPGAESGTTGWIDTAGFFTNNSADLTAQGLHIRSGFNAFRCETLVDPGTDHRGMTGEVVVVGSTTYQITVWVICDDDETADLRLAIGESGFGTASHDFTATDEWQKVILEYTPISDGLVDVAMFTQDDSAVVWYTDDWCVAVVPNFEDVAGDLESLSVARGRQSEEDGAQGGRLQATLIDTERDYDANNTLGPHYGDLNPVKPIRLRATLGDRVYDMFTGWIDVQGGWQRTEKEPGAAFVQLPATDGFEVLTAAATVQSPSAKASEQSSGERIVEALDQAEWPGTGEYTGIFREIDTGQTDVQASDDMYGPFDATSNPVNYPVLRAIRDAEVSEGGFFYFTGSGIATYKDRHQRILADLCATFDDASIGSTIVKFTEMTTRRTPIYNTASVTRNGSTPQVFQDTSSVTEFLVRPTAVNTAHTTDADAMSMAEWIVHLKKDSYEILESITFEPGTDEATWHQVLGRELNDRIRVSWTPAGGGAAVTQDFFIEAIQFNWGPNTESSCTWRLSSAYNQFNYWQAAVPGSSEAGTTTKAVW